MDTEQVPLGLITRKLWLKIKGHNSRRKRNKIREAIIAHLDCTPSDYYEYMNGRKKLHPQDANYIHNLIVSYQCRA